MLAFILKKIDRQLLRILKQKCRIRSRHCAIVEESL